MSSLSRTRMVTGSRSSRRIAFPRWATNQNRSIAGHFQITQTNSLAAISVPGNHFTLPVGHAGIHPALGMGGTHDHIESGPGYLQVPLGRHVAPACVLGAKRRQGDLVRLQRHGLTLRRDPGTRAVITPVIAATP